MRITYSRRDFLNKSSAAMAGIALGATTFSAQSYSRILGANDRVNFAVVGLHGRGRGVTIHGTEGTILMDRDGYEIYDQKDEKVFEYKKEEKEGSMDVVGSGPITRAHFQNFINGILLGEKLNSPIIEGNVAATMLHLSNIAWKFGRQLEVNPENGHIRHDKKAMSMWRREYEPGWEPKI